MSRRHVDCESIRDEHVRCATTIDSLRQQLEESEENIAALKIDIQRLVTENNHSNEMAVMQQVNDKLTKELRVTRESEAALMGDLQEAQQRTNAYKYDAETLDLVMDSFAKHVKDGHEQLQQFHVTPATILSCIDETFGLLKQYGEAQEYHLNEKNWRDP